MIYSAYRSRRRFASLLAMLSLLLPPSVSAELFGLTHGRSAFPDNNAAVGLGAGFVASGDYLRYGLRINYQASTNLTLYGDMSEGRMDIAEADDAEGPAFGVGLYYYLPRQRFTDLVDLAAHASVHRATIDGGEVENFGRVEYDYLVFSLDFLVSGVEPLLDNGLGWYASIGLSQASIELQRGGSGDESDALLSGGVYLPFASGEWYAGLEYLDGEAIGVGYRYHLR